MTGRAFVDTNVVVYAFDDDEPDKQERARDLLSDRGDEVLVLSTQVLAEFFVTVTRKLTRPLDPGTARQAVAELSELPIVRTDTDLVLAGIDLADRYQLSVWEGLIVQAAVVGGCESIFTEDLANGSDLAGVRIQNPFAAVP
jgi:predicted nucleic acid-binding protein